MNDIEFLSLGNRILLQHDQRIDGNGYPFGLKGDQIDIKAKVLAVADAYDAMISSRPYRKAQMTSQEALNEIERNKGSQFDFTAAQTFIDLIRYGQLINNSVC